LAAYITISGRWAKKEMSKVHFWFYIQTAGPDGGPQQRHSRAQSMAASCGVL